MYDMGLEHLRAMDYEAASLCFQDALRSDPNDVKSRLALASVYVEQYRMDDALDLLGSLDHPLASQVRGKAYFQLNDLAQSLHWFEASLSTAPNNPLCRVQYAHSLLKAGRYIQGWRENECRFAAQVYGPDFGKGWNVWNAQELKTASLFVFPEGGFGDVIQMMRYVPLLREFGENIVLGCSPELQNLLGHLGVRVSLTYVPSSYQVASMSLPHIFRTTIDSIPNRYPYLFTRGSTESARRKTGATFKVGLVWGGITVKVYAHMNAVRSVDLKKLRGLSEIPNVALFSLQHPRNEAHRQLETCGFPIGDLMKSEYDFLDTAKLIEGLDLVISVDTSVVHLAGALNKPCWLISRFASCWRWMNDEYSKWYPSVRIFRQTRLHDWDTVITTVEGELRQLMATSENGQP